MSNSLNIGSKIVSHLSEEKRSQCEIAKAFGVTIDYLIGYNENSSLDKKDFDRINHIQKIDSDTKTIFSIIVANRIQNFLTKQAFAK